MKIIIITRFIYQDSGLYGKISDQDLAVLTKLYQACLYSKVKVIGLWVLQENKALQLANQKACHIGYENKSFNSE